MTSRSLWVLLLLAPLAACSSSGPGRAVSGQLQKGAYKVDNPVVIAQSSDHRTFITHVQANGQFKLNLPSGPSYRLLLANTTASGYSAISRIMWPNKSHWVQLAAGATVKLGTLHPAGAPALQNATVQNPQGENDDDQGEDEDEDDGAAVCNAAGMGDSDDDDNDQGEQEGMNQDDNENDDEMNANQGPGGMCCAGGASSTHEDSEGDDGQGTSGQPAAGGSTTCGGTGGTPPGGTPPGGGTPPAPTMPTAGGAGAGSACQLNSDCATGLACVANVCMTTTGTVF
jgi:hypothetical protein